MSFRWGIAGVGKIAHDFHTALQSNLSSNDHKVVAVASRCKSRSEEFARNHNVSKSYGNYEDLAGDMEIDIVYVAALNVLHYEICMLMINSGKHILCEKPFCMNYIQAKKVVDFAEAKGVFIMEGIWSRFFPAYAKLSELIDIGGLGDIKEVYVKHGFEGQHNERIIKKNLGGGIVLDIGVYAIQLVLFVMRERPTSIKTTGKVNQEGVDVAFEAEFTFSNGRIAKIHCSGMEAFENQATIISTKGVICMPTYWCPTSLIGTDGKKWDWPLESPESVMNFTNSMGLSYEADEVLKCIRSKKLICEIMPPTETLLIAEIQDEIRKQIKVLYECDL